MLGKTREIVRRFHRDQGGQAIFIGVLYFILLAALVFLVLNSGDKTNNKTAMQNAADATAYTGASWYSRGLNTISMCNVTQTQIMSVIVLLDSLETTVPVAKDIIDSLVSDLANSAHGSDVQNHPNLKDWAVVGNALVEQQMLNRLNTMISRIPMEEYCAYDDGVLWQSCFVLNELATQVAMITPEMAQREAINVGKENNAKVAFVLPFYPELPIEEIDNSGRSFINFKEPMRNARHPKRRDRRGRRIQLRGYWNLQHYRSQRGGNRGPFLYMREPFTDPSPMGLFELSRLSVLMKTVSDRKFEMLFGNADPRVCLTSRIEDYDELLDFVAANGRSAVVKTYWSIQSFRSRNEYGTSSFLTTTNLRDPQYPRERLRDFKGFRQAPAGYTRATTQGQGADPRHDLWYRSREARTYHYPALGIYASHPPIDDDGNSWPYGQDEYKTYYRNSLWRFDGAETQLETELHRRYLPPAGQPPHTAPILLAGDAIPASERTSTSGADWEDVSSGETEPHVFYNFSFMGFAYMPGRSEVWPRVFTNPVPTEGKLVCYAQSEVYNLTSWDLFSQNWRTYLVKMDHWNESLKMIEAGPPSIADLANSEIDDEMLEPVRRMLQQYSADWVDKVSH
ncbi:MAG: hypothetical protein GWP05_04145 [Anaerolineaceae bacterium]|nr:hypothetical protein [Anaerolineaceae bacterium]